MKGLYFKPNSSRMIKIKKNVCISKVIMLNKLYLKRNYLDLKLNLRVFWRVSKYRNKGFVNRPPEPPELHICIFRCQQTQLLRIHSGRVENWAQKRKWSLMPWKQANCQWSVTQVAVLTILALMNMTRVQTVPTTPMPVVFWCSQENGRTLMWTCKEVWWWMQRHPRLKGLWYLMRRRRNVTAVSYNECFLTLNFC